VNAWINLLGHLRWDGQYARWFSRRWRRWPRWRLAVPRRALSDRRGTVVVRGWPGSPWA